MSVPKDFVNRWTDMVFIFSEASYNLSPGKVYNNLGEGMSTLKRKISPRTKLYPPKYFPLLFSNLNCKLLWREGLLSYLPTLGAP